MTPVTRHRGSAIALIIAALAAVAMTAAAAPPVLGQGVPGFEIRGSIPDAPPPRAAPGLPGAAPQPPAGPAAGALPPSATAPGRITFAAQLTDDGQRIDSGLLWSVFDEARQPGEKPRLVTTVREAAPTIELKPGSYFVNVSFGRAYLNRKIVVAPGRVATEAFVLNAGGLRINAQLDKGTPVPANTVSIDILSDERDQSGQRTRVVTGARPGVVYRLNAGLYHIVSTLGDANAIVRSDVTVEAGKLTEAAARHQAARVTFRLVARAGGEALADTQWVLQGRNGETVKESAGALPTHVIAPGSYVITARNAGRNFRREFAVQGGDVVQVEVVMQ